MHVDRQAGSQAVKQADGQTDGQRMVKRAGGQAGRQTDGGMDGQVGGQAGRQAGRQADKCHRGGKRTWPDRDSNPRSLAYRASKLPQTYRATRSTGYISPCLIRFVPKSARKHAGTDDTISFRLLLAARGRTHTEPLNVKGAEKECAPTGTRTQGLSLTVQALYH